MDDVEVRQNWWRSYKEIVLRKFSYYKTLRYYNLRTTPLYQEKAQEWKYWSLCTKISERTTCRISAWWEIPSCGHNSQVSIGYHSWGRENLLYYFKRTKINHACKPIKLNWKVAVPACQKQSHHKDAKVLCWRMTWTEFPFKSFSLIISRSAKLKTGHPELSLIINHFT